MKKTFRLSILLILFLLVFVPIHSAQAQGPNPDGGGQVIFGSNYTVKSGDTFEGDLVVFGGNVTIEEDASLNGDLVVMGGTVKSNGKTSGSIVVVGGQVNLEKSALVVKDVVMIGSQLNKADGAVVKGNIVNNASPNISIPPARIPPTAPSAPSAPPAPVVPNVPIPNVNIDFHPFRIFVWIVGVPAFAMLLALFWQPQIERTGQAILSQPVIVGAIGLLSTVVAGVLFLTILPPVLLVLAWFFGVVAMGAQVGERFTKAVNQAWSPVVSIGFGTFLLVVVGGVIGSIPCVGWLVVFLFGLVGAGAAVITLFGTRPIQVPGLTVYTPPTNSSPPVG